MNRSEEIDLREGLVYDAYVKGADSNFWKGDTANLTFDTVKNAIKVGDTGLIGSASSYSQYQYGDFEFTLTVDSLSPDSNDGASAAQGKRWGLLNKGDTRERGAAYFEMRYDTVTAGDTANTRPLRAVIVSEAGVKQQKNITWDTLWMTNARYRISWEADGYSFLVNDTVVATLGDKPDSSNSVFQVNTSIPQALRLQNSTLDTVDTSSMSVKLITIRHARKII
jgi:hypothetical protein